MNKSISYYVSKYNELKKQGNVEGLDEYRIYISRSFTIEQIEAIFAVEIFNLGFFPVIKIGSFGQIIQDAIDKNSELYKFNPDLVIIAGRIDDSYNIRVINNLSSKILSDYEIILRSLKENNIKNILVHNFEIPDDLMESLYSYQNVHSLVNTVRSVNHELIELTNRFTGSYILDIENIISRLGYEKTYDNRMWYIARNPYSKDFYLKLAEEYIKNIKAIHGIRKKCIVLDLDNTLWGGIIGEDGIEGIKLGDEYPGRCFKDFQRQLLDLNNRGIILAINSKNNYEDAMNVINNHPDMILSEENFAVMKINWENKAKNMEEISTELNIGLDSLVFIDDNPVECGLVKSYIPEVEVIQAPEDPVKIVDILENISYFEMLTITEEDLSKAVEYKNQAKRLNFKSEFNNIEEYYKSLEMKILFDEVNEFTLARVSQLTQKTNQFNLTTKRYTEEDIRRMLDKNYRVFTISVKDKFGDNGLTGVIIVEQSRDIWIIDSFLLSCRVMGRNIEYAFMGRVISLARESNISKIKANYYPTKKNKPVENLYEDMGFEKEDGAWIFETFKEFKNIDYIEVLDLNGN